VFPMDPSECLDTDFDGIGDNSDAFPNDARETKDSDGDGLGDNSDAFPNDPGAKYDADGDGVANAYDAFPNSASFSSWQGAVMWGVALLLAVSGVAVVYQRRRLEHTDVLDELTHTSMIDASFNRPTFAPGVGAFAPAMPADEPASPTFNHPQDTAVMPPHEAPLEEKDAESERVLHHEEVSNPTSGEITPDLVEQTPASDDDWGSLGSAWGD